MSTEFGPRLTALTLATGLMLGSCSAESPEPAPNPTPSSGSTEHPDLRFLKTPDTNFSSANCRENSDTWAVNPDPNPLNVEEDVFTVGFSEEATPEGEPILISGATTRALGNFAYEIATSDDKHGETTTVNLREAPYSRVLQAGEGYKAILTAHLGDNGFTYVGLRCLTDFGFGTEQDVPEVAPDPFAIEPDTIAI